MRDLDRMVRINAAGDEPDLQLNESQLLLEMPPNINEMKAIDLGTARKWQSGVRTACLHYFQAGYMVTDFFSLG